MSQPNSEYQIETRRRSRSRTPLIESLTQQAESIRKKKKAANVLTIVEETEVIVQKNGVREKTSGARNVTSDYSSSNSTPERKRRSSTRITEVQQERVVDVELTTSTPIVQTRAAKMAQNIKAFAGGFSSSTPIQNKSGGVVPSSAEARQSLLHASHEDFRHSANSFASPAQTSRQSPDPNESDHIAYKMYREAGEYWNVTPKTDYTYSRLSPHRRELAPGIIAMPNMSRESLNSHGGRIQSMIRRNPQMESYIRNRYEGQRYGKGGEYSYGYTDETDITSYRPVEMQPPFYRRWFSQLYVSCTKVFSRTQRTTTSTVESRKSIIAHASSFVSTVFLSVFHFIYLLISSALCVDTWLLRSSRPKSGLSKFFSILLLLMLPLLLLTAYQRSGHTINIKMPTTPNLQLPSLRQNYDTVAATLKKALHDFGGSRIMPEAPNVPEQEQILFSKRDTETILAHINNYIDESLRVKAAAAQDARQSEQQTQLLADALGETLQRYVSTQRALQSTDLTDSDIERLALQVHAKLTALGDWPAAERVPLNGASLHEINKLIKQQLVVHSEVHARQDFEKLLHRILSAEQLAGLVDLRINAALQSKLTVAKDRNHIELERKISELNNNIAQLKVMVADKMYDEVAIRDAFNALKRAQEALERRLNAAEQNTEAQLKLLIDEKLRQMEGKQSALLNEQIRVILADILGLQGEVSGALLENWVSSMFVAKAQLEERLIAVSRQSHERTLEQTERMSAELLRNISAIVKTQLLAQHNEQHNTLLPTAGRHLSVDEVKKIVQTQLEIYDADKTGLSDYALESAGGEILSTRCTDSARTKSAELSIFGIPLWYPSNSPRTVISPNVHAGDCWAFTGFPGFLVIKLNSLIHVTGFTLEHLPKVLSPTGRIESAPKHFSVWGLESEHDHHPVLFGEYQYLQNGNSRQYFPVQNQTIRNRYQIVELRIESNHGEPRYTCLYRFRVHGSANELATEN